jgi:hypothetical protein
MNRLNSPRQTWFERLELLTHNLTRPLRRRRRKRLASPESGWAARLELITYNLSLPLRRRRQKRLASPGSRWTVKLSQLLRHLTRPVRRVLRVWLRPVRKKWNNRSLSQRTSFGLLALGVVILVVGAAVILPNAGRVATSSFNAVQGRSEVAQRAAEVPQGTVELDTTTTQGRIVACGDPDITTAIQDALPEAQVVGVLCSTNWLSVSLTAGGDQQSRLTAYAKSGSQGLWELVAITTDDDQSVIGDSARVPRGVRALADQAFAAPLTTTADS